MSGDRGFFYLHAPIAIVLYLPEVVALIMRYANKYRLPKMKPSFTSMPTRKECTLYAFTKHSINSTTIIYK